MKMQENKQGIGHGRLRKLRKHQRIYSLATSQAVKEIKALTELPSSATQRLNGFTRKDKARIKPKRKQLRL